MIVSNQVRVELRRIAEAIGLRPLHRERQGRHGRPPSRGCFWLLVNLISEKGVVSFMHRVALRLRPSDGTKARPLLEGAPMQSAWACLDLASEPALP